MTTKFSVIILIYTIFDIKIKDYTIYLLTILKQNYKIIKTVMNNTIL